MTPSSARLVRLLTMVPYFQANPRVTYRKAAADLGVTRSQLQQDLNQLWMCGLPGYGPGDLIDFEFSGETITVTFSAGIDRPLRLNSAEASGLLVALRALAEIPGVVDPAAALSAIAKIEAAVGTARDPQIADGDPVPVEAESAAVVREALRGSRAVSLEYHSASRDVLSARVVDPIRVVLVGDHSYLQAWCREAEGERLFRFDRIVGARLLDEPSVPPKRAVDAPRPTALFEADPALPSARLRVTPQAAWVAEYFPMRVLSVSGGGDPAPAEHQGDSPGLITAEMTYASPEWMARQILGFGADVQVSAPSALAEQVRRTALAGLAAYAALDAEPQS